MKYLLIDADATHHYQCILHLKLEGSWFGLKGGRAELTRTPNGAAESRVELVFAQVQRLIELQPRLLLAQSRFLMGVQVDIASQTFHLIQQFLHCSRSMFVQHRVDTQVLILLLEHFN